MSDLPLDAYTRTKELADGADIHLRWTGARWEARDQWSGDVATGRTVPDAWAALRGSTPERIREWLLDELQG